VKILGIDYGTKHIGMAISDETQSLARELTILSPQEFWQGLNELIAAEEITKIVVGLPLNMSGEDTEKTKEARAFAEKLQTQSSVAVELVDERLSSSMAEQIAGTSKHIDSLAAQIILQTYLDRNKN
jgi:putative holliday junction resolvase